MERQRRYISSLSNYFLFRSDIFLLQDIANRLKHSYTVTIIESFENFGSGVVGNAASSWNQSAASVPYYGASSWSGYGGYQ
jgi:hypothetical protein